MVDHLVWFQIALSPDPQAWHNFRLELFPLTTLVCRMNLNFLSTVTVRRQNVSLCGFVRNFRQRTIHFSSCWSIKTSKNCRGRVEIKLGWYRSHSPKFATYIELCSRYWRSLDISTYAFALCEERHKSLLFLTNRHSTSI